MNPYQLLFEILEPDRKIDSEHAAQIDAELSKVAPIEIEDVHTNGVMDYINFRLLHGSVAEPIKGRLESLYDALSARSRNA